MEIANMDDFIRLENKVDQLTKLINMLINEKFEINNSKSQIMNVVEVAQEFKQSSYHQRKARASGKLKFIPTGREIQYTRADVENWIQTKILY